MKLFYAPASPFVRKVLVLAIETGLDDRIEKVGGALTPIEPPADLVASNPVGKIPTLVTDDGAALYDSRVICEYLDGLHDGAKLFPSDPDKRLAALTRQALADAIMDAAVLSRYETMLRPEAYRWPEWIEGQLGKVRRGLDQLEREAASLAGPLDIGIVASGCALGYLDFRFADEGWRDARPALASWYDGFAARDSMKATVPAG